MTLMYKLAALFGLCCSLYLIGSRIYKFIKTREKAQAAGIIHTQIIPLAKPWLLVIDVLLMIFLCYNVYVQFHNRAVYAHRVEFVEQYGIDDILEITGISEDAISDKEQYTKRYIQTYKNKTERATWGGIADISFLLLILSLNLWLIGGYVTTEGWYWMFTSAKPEVIHIKEEQDKLCFYLGTAGSPVMKLPDTLDNREKFALIMENEEEIEV
ncbi:MAG: hypothetical protein J5851_06210 [Oscillospiraceae bacterium]|nr:hypothetical protein [Oscillospiraceae bacterium]